MSVYKIIFRIASDSPEPEDRTKWEPGCPLMFEAVQVSRDTETGRAFLQARIKNIGVEEVSSFRAVFSCVFSDGGTADFETNPLDADILPAHGYILTPIELPQGDIVSADGRICSAVLPASVWSSSSQPAPLPQRRPLDLSERTLNERRLQLGQLGCSDPGEIAPFGVEDHGSWTLCACGTPSMGFESCPTCGLPFEASGEFENQARLELLAEKRASDQIRLEQEQREQDRRKKARTRQTVKIVTVAVVSLCAIAAIAMALKFVMVDVPEKARQEAYTAVVNLKHREEAADLVQGMIDEHYANMSDEHKEYCLKLLGLKLCGDKAWGLYAPENATDGHFTGNFDEEGNRLVGTMVLTGSLPTEEGSSTAQQFSITCSAEYRIDIEEGTVDVGSIDLESSTLTD